MSIDCGASGIRGDRALKSRLLACPWDQQIAAAAEQQSAVAEEINRSVLNVRDVSEQTSAASEETAASSVELARLGTHLQMLVGRFKV